MKNAIEKAVHKFVGVHNGCGDPTACCFNGLKIIDDHWNLIKELNAIAIPIKESKALEEDAYRRGHESGWLACEKKSVSKDILREKIGELSIKYGGTVYNRDRKTLSKYKEGQVECLELIKELFEILNSEEEKDGE